MMGAQFPSFAVTPKAAHQNWEDVRDLCGAYGLRLDEWQENVFRSAMGERSDGTWAASRVGLSVPRQSGKTALFEARELAGLLLFDEQLILHSAHLVATALEGFQRIKGYFENYDDLRRKVRRIREANGDQGIEMMSGQRLRFMARSKSSGRGFSADALLLDEAQELSDPTWAAILPTMSARPNPQAWLAGTPPGPEANGEVFTRMRAAAKDGKDSRLCWMEWSCPDDVDLDDRRAWAQANPGLGRRIDTSAIAGERAAMDETTFARERLGVWFRSGGTVVIPEDTWASLADEHSTPMDPVSFAIDVSPDRVTSIAVAGVRPDGRVHVEVVENRGGTAWVPDRVADLVAQWSPSAVVMDPSGPVGALKPALLDRGVPLKETTAREMAQACEAFLSAILEGGLRYRDRYGLTSAVLIARKRPLGNSWAWNRKDRSSDISPLVAATLAVYGHAAYGSSTSSDGWMVSL
jgi:phage terminase large subunit-like protein